MELPVAVQQALGDVAKGVSLRDLGQAGRQELLRMVLLSDGQEKLQVICRKADVVDLEQLNEHFDRDFELMKPAEQVLVKDRTGLRELPALPSLTGWPAVVDPRVDALPFVALELEEQRLAMVMPVDDFRELTSHAQRRSFTIPEENVSVNLNNPGDDRKQLNSSLRKFTRLRIQQRLEDTLEVPPLSETAERIIQLRVNPNAVMADLVDIVESDPPLAAQVVSWASSSFYAAAGDVRSVYDAISRVLGFDMVMNLAMGLALGRAIKLPKHHPYGYVSYWQQAIWQAHATGILTSMMPPLERPAFGLAYLGGLLHNFGYLLLAHVFPPHFRLLCRSLEVNPDIDSAVIEQHLLGITREQIAAQLLESWGMPEEVVQAVRYQKQPGYQGALNVYPKLLWLSRQLLIARGVKLGANEVVGQKIYDELSLNRAKVEDTFDKLVANEDGIMAIAGLMAQ
ncbi:HDOD domain-containing protein [Marinobacter piscensis]|uniref:HDOD domain-containing protein n=1 Tax=Marinobacter piscensis TaxID=1562308 RepID=UPI0011AAD9A2|nr:HDOD domain-containing protein [Marinobacter piscensis]